MGPDLSQIVKSKSGSASLSVFQILFSLTSNGLANPGWVLERTLGGRSGSLDSFRIH